MRATYAVHATLDAIAAHERSGTVLACRDEGCNAAAQQMSRSTCADCALPATVAESPLSKATTTGTDTASTDAPRVRIRCSGMRQPTANSRAADVQAPNPIAADSNEVCHTSATNKPYTLHTAQAKAASAALALIALLRAPGPSRALVGATGSA